MVIPELPPDIAELKQRVGRFVAAEVFPLEEEIAAAGAIDFAAVDAVRKKARAAGFSMLNMPEEAGGAGFSMLGQVALEEESEKATNGRDRIQDCHAERRLRQSHSGHAAAALVGRAVTSSLGDPSW